MRILRGTLGQIMRKCESLWPELDRSKVVGVSVGLRPSGKEVRLEVENISRKVSCPHTTRPWRSRCDPFVRDVRTR